MLKEVLVVEGKMDTVAIRRALEADTIETGGFTLAPYTLRQIEAAYKKRGIIILTDPDGAGERIRRFLTERFPEAGQAFIPKIQATANNDVGVEQAQPEAILAALAKVRHHDYRPQGEFTHMDLFRYALNGSPQAAARRDALGAELGIGYGNAKRFLERLNHYGVTREEFLAALAKLDNIGEWNVEKPVIASPQVTQHILNRFKLRADKKLGQNFLIDEQVVRQIVAAAELSEADTVLEVGPGIGTLTQGLAESKAQVVAVELDTRLLPVLATTLEGYDNVRVVHGDILKVNIMEEVGVPNFKVCANLPYYITTPIIFALLEKRLPMERLVAMVQKEVAERMAAQPGGKDYGALSVAIQYYTEPEIAFIVPPTSFIPAPAVDSAVIVCKRREKPPVEVCDEALFFRVVKAAFSLRRKMLSNSLKNMGIKSEQVAKWLELAGVDGKRRAETLSLEDFAKLTNSFNEAVK